MSDEKTQKPIATRQPAGSSVLNRLANLAGFWMAVFSLAGVVMLTVAGPVIQKRMTNQISQSSGLNQPAMTTRGHADGENESRTLMQSANRYSLDGIRGTLAIFFLVGVVWTCVSMLKSKG